MYIIDELKLKELLASKLDAYYQEAVTRFALNNSNFSTPSLTDEASKFLGLLQRKEIEESKVSEHIMEEIREFIKKANELEESLTSGELNIALFTKEEIKKYLEITDADIEQILADVKKKEHIQES